MPKKLRVALRWSWKPMPWKQNIQTLMTVYASHFPIVDGPRDSLVLLLKKKIRKNAARKNLRPEQRQSINKASSFCVRGWFLFDARTWNMRSSSMCMGTQRKGNISYMTAINIDINKHTITPKSPNVSALSAQRTLLFTTWHQRRSF